MTAAKIPAAAHNIHAGKYDPRRSKLGEWGCETIHDIVRSRRSLIICYQSRSTPREAISWLAERRIRSPWPDATIGAGGADVTRSDILSAISACLSRWFRLPHTARRAKGVGPSRALKTWPRA